MSKEIKKVISLAKKTGDRIVVFDPEEGGENFVIMSLEEYENLLDQSGKLNIKESIDEEIKDLTENELIDKINRNIAVWKNENKDKELDSYKIIETVLQSESEERKDSEEKSEGDDYEEDNLYYYNEEESDENTVKGRSWAIPLDVKKGAEEVKE
ncbi:hypothetical protein K8R62_02060 [bacterium]|nr:hypothetical protein [bacterium]